MLPNFVHRAHSRPKLVVITSIALVLLALAGFRLGEPRYEGKRVSQWVRELKIGVKAIQKPDGSYLVMLPNLSDEELARLKISPKIKTCASNSMLIQSYSNWPDQVGFYYPDALENDPAGRAIKSMGTAALPCLRSGLQSRESKVADLFYRFVWPRVPERLQGWVGKPVHPIHLRANSAYALGLLGAVARPAAPELRRLLREEVNPLVRAVALEALQRIEPGEILQLYPELFNQSRPAVAAP